METEPLETMHAGRVFVLHNMHISLDFSSVDFQGMLEVLGLLPYSCIEVFEGISCDEVITVPLLLCLCVLMIL